MRNFNNNNVLMNRQNSSIICFIFWIDRADLKTVPLADGFETMLEIFEQPQLTENFYWFEDGEWKMENR